jgi:hypothetical protein
MHVEKEFMEIDYYVGSKSWSLQICCPKKSPYGVMMQWLTT